MCRMVSYDLIGVAASTVQMLEANTVNSMIMHATITK